jgi:hypothetical protein
VSVLFAVLLVLLLLPIGAVVVDFGFWYTNAKKTQNAADAGALAAAADIPSGPIVATGEQWVLRNYPSVNPSDIQVNYPYLGRVDEVEVIVKHPSPTFFGRIFGTFGVESTRRAVAEQWKVPGTLAIYVHSQLCAPGESLYFNGEDMHISGWVHTQGGLGVSVAGPPQPQPNFTASEGTMRSQPGNPGVRACSHDIQPFNQVADFWAGEDNDFLPEPRPGFDWPVYYKPSQFGWYNRPTGTASPTQCRFRANKIEIENTQIKMSGPDSTFNYSGGVLPTGIYCGREIVEFKNSINLSGTVTVLAEEIKTNAQDRQLNLTAYAGTPDPVLFFSVPNSTGWQNNPPVGYVPSAGQLADDGPPPSGCHNKLITLNSGTGTVWSGLIFHPCGKVLINQPGSHGTGSIIAEQVHINGSGFDFTGQNNFSATIEIGLVE